MLAQGHRQSPPLFCPGTSGTTWYKTEKTLSTQPAPVRTAGFLDVLALDHLGGTPHHAISPIPV